MKLGIRTDSKTATVILRSSEDTQIEETWEAHKQLSDQLLKKIEDLLKSDGKDLKDIAGLFVFKGPGSFTGLRIGITVANSLSQGLAVPIVAVSGDAWVEDGLQRLNASENDNLVIPEYGAEPNITKPKK